MLSSENKNNYYKGLVFAIALHVVLLLFMLMHFDSNFTQAQLNMGQNIKIIQAHAIMDNSVTQKIENKVEKQKQEEVQEQTPPPPVAASKVPLAQPKEIAFKSKIKPEPKPKPVVKAVPQPKVTPEVKPKPVVKPVPKSEVKPKVDPALTQAQRMQALAQKLQAQARQSLQQQVQTEQGQLDQQLAQAQRTQGVVDKYKALILQQVGQHWIVPEVNKNISCRLLISLAPGGTVLDVKLVESSGNAALDRSAIQAVYKASPLPVPSDSSAFNAMRELDMIVRPESAVSKVISN